MYQPVYSEQDAFSLAAFRSHLERMIQSHGLAAAAGLLYWMLDAQPPDDPALRRACLRTIVKARRLDRAEFEAWAVQWYCWMEG